MIKFLIVKSLLGIANDNVDIFLEFWDVCFGINENAQKLCNYDILFVL